MSAKYLGGTKEAFTNAVGTELCWGWSPAVDFLALLEELRTGNKPGTSTTAAKKKEKESDANKKQDEEKEKKNKKSRVEEIDDDDERDGKQPPAGDGGAAAAAVAAPEEQKAPASAPAAQAPKLSQQKKKPTVVAFDEDGFPIVGDEAPAAAASAADHDGKEEKQQQQQQQQQEPLRVLLVGAADVRHVICTLSRAKRTELGRSGRPIHFYIFEPSLRVHCRHLLFLQMMLVDLVTLSELEDRVSMVLEIFGNSMIRDVTAGAFKSAATAASAALEFDDEQDGKDDKHTNENSNSNSNSSTTKKTNPKLAGWLDWTHMKNKEKDFIAQQLLLWTKDRTSVDIVSQWDTRVRNELAERYDNRVNIFDWDFHFNLLDYSQTLRFAEYREFRKMGQAFDYCRINPRRGFRYDYTVPNKSLAMFPQRAAGKDHDGRGELKGQYYGDVKNGPFYAIGHNTENANLKKREIDGTTIFGCGIIALHTIRGWLYELVTGGEKPFPVDIEHKTAWEDEKNYNFLPSDAPEPHVEFTPQVPLDVKFSFVGLDIDRFFERIVREQQQQQQQQNGGAQEEGFFDAAFFGATSTQWMTPLFFKSMKKKNGLVVAETLKFVVDAGEEAKRTFESKIVDELAAAANWKLHRELTERLHELQTPPKQRPEGLELDAAMKRAIVRQKMNFQVVLVPNN